MNFIERSITAILLGAITGFLMIISEKLSKIYYELITISGRCKDLLDYFHRVLN